jgi:hypothetical protein
LSSRGLLDADESGALSIHGWRDRQYESDDVTARTRRYRSKERAPKAAENEFTKFR